MSQILLTGATGCTGRNLLHHLQQTSHTVLPIDRKMMAEKNLIGEIVIHTAAITPNTGNDFSANLLLTHQALQLTPHLKQFILVSSCSVLGDTLEGMADDSAKPAPDSIYAETKLLCENEVIGFCTARNIPYTILRPGLIYGPHDRGVMKTMIGMIAKGYFFQIGNGDTRKSLTAVDLLSEAIVKAIENPAFFNEILLVIDPQSYTIGEIRNAIASKTGKNPKIFSVPLWLIEQSAKLLQLFEKMGFPFPIRAKDLRRAYINRHYQPTKLKERMGHVPVYFDTTLQNEIEWYQGIKK